MSGAGIGGGAIAHISLTAKLAAKAAAVAVAKAMGSSAAEVQAAVQDMIDLGFLQDQDDGLAYCPNGHSFDCSRGACPTCGAEPGDPPSASELLSPDDEILRDEERASSEEEDDPWPLLADEPGLLEQIERALIDCGCPDAQDVAMKLAPLWDKGPPTDSAAVLRLAEDNGWLPATVECIEKAFEIILLERERNQRPPADSQSSAEIRIWREDEHLRWEVTDHLAGFAATGRSGLVTLGGVQFSNHARAEKLLRERVERLEALAKELTKRRKAFFDELDPARAKGILGREPLTQKDVCAVTGIPPAVLSRWCDYRGRTTRTSKKVGMSHKSEMSTRIGVEVETPHGVFPLAAFFSKPARVIGGTGQTRDAIKENVESLLAEAKKQGLDSADIAKLVLEEHGVVLAGRTVRKYLNEYSNEDL